MKVIIALLALGLTMPAHAGKIETVKESVKKACSVDLDDNAALAMVKKAFLSCTPGQDIDVNGSCSIKCLKDNAGAVVGG